MQFFLDTAGREFMNTGWKTQGVPMNGSSNQGPQQPTTVVQTSTATGMANVANQAAINSNGRASDHKQRAVNIFARRPISSQKGIDRLLEATVVAAAAGAVVTTSNRNDQTGSTNFSHADTVVTSIDSNLGTSVRSEFVASRTNSRKRQRVKSPPGRDHLGHLRPPLSAPRTDDGVTAGGVASGASSDSEPTPGAPNGCAGGEDTMLYFPTKWVQPVNVPRC